MALLDTPHINVTVNYSNAASIYRTFSPSAPSKERFLYLDGVRGIASLSVALWHNFISFFPAAVNASYPSHSYFLENVLYKSPLSVLFAGDFAVFIFYALSGFVISLSYFKSDDREGLKKSFLRRYVRLMPPAFFTIAVAYVLIRSGANANVDAAKITGSWWLPIHWTHTDASLRNMLWSGIYGMWFSPVGADASFNSNLGTLSIEIIGSCAIFAYILVTKIAELDFQRRLVAHASFLALTFWFGLNDPNYLVFFSGMVLADLFANRPSFFCIPARTSWLLFAIGAFLGSVNIANLGMPHYVWLNSLFRALGLHPLVYPWSIGAITIVYSVLANRSLQTVFSKGVFQFLGRYSFPLYLCHTIFVCSITSIAVVWLNTNFSITYGQTVVLAFFGTLPLLVLFTYLVGKVDDWAVRASRSLA